MLEFLEPVSMRQLCQYNKQVMQLEELDFKRMVQPDKLLGIFRHKQFCVHKQFLRADMFLGAELPGPGKLLADNRSDFMHFDSWLRMGELLSGGVLELYDTSHMHSLNFQRI